MRFVADSWLNACRAARMNGRQGLFLSVHVDGFVSSRLFGTLTGNVYLSSKQEDYSYQCMWTISNWQARQKT